MPVTATLDDDDGARVLLFFVSVDDGDGARTVLMPDCPFAHCSDGRIDDFRGPPQRAVDGRGRSDCSGLVPPLTVAGIVDLIDNGGVVEGAIPFRGRSETSSS